MPPPTVPRDPEYDAAREAYQQEKAAAVQQRLDLLARVNRLGYDLDITTRRDHDAT